MNNNIALEIQEKIRWKIGKSDGELLWAHQYNTWNIFKKFIEFKVIPYTDERTLKVIELGVLLHDLKKSCVWNQMILKGETDLDKLLDAYKNFWNEKGIKLSNEDIRKAKKLFKSGKTDHQIQTENDKKYILKEYIDDIKHKLDFDITEKDINIIFDIIKHHFITDDNIVNSDFPGFGNYIKILKYCDKLSSLRTIDFNLINEINNLNIGRKIFTLTFFTFSREIKPSAAILFETAIEEYKKNNWDVLLIFETGILFICKGAGIVPQKDKIINNCFDKFIEKNLESINLEWGRKNIFTGIQKSNPQKFLEIKKNFIQGLFTPDNVHRIFFKLLGEIYSLLNIKNLRKDYPIIDIILGLISGVRGIGKATDKFVELEKGNIEHLEIIKKNDILKYFYENKMLSDIIIKEYMGEHNIKNKKISELLGEELINVLSILCSKVPQDEIYNENIKKIYDTLLQIEEEKDFGKIALEQFEKYKLYKQNPGKENQGICEICGITVVQKPGADFDSIKAFSQVKADPNKERKVCPLCSFDNTMLKQRVKKGIPVYVRIYSKFTLNPFTFNINDFINQIESGLTKLYELKKESKYFPDLEFPFSEEKNKDNVEILFNVYHNNHICYSLNVSGESEKDLSIQYAPMYYLLKLLGFKVHIGREEQIGLFGKELSVTKEKYYKSLVTIILAQIIKRARKKKGKIYIFANELLENSPSVAISLMDQLNYQKKSKKIYIDFFNCLIKSDKEFKKLGGEVSMKDLIEDAKYFAENIPLFCWSNDDRNKWFRSSSKHLITKPISDFFNEVLVGRDYEEAIVKFLFHLKKDISSKSMEETGYKTDTESLKNFVEQSKERLKKYYEIKQKNITDFIRIKNALHSAIFTFKRYDILKEVNFNE